MFVKKIYLDNKELKNLAELEEKLAESSDVIELVEVTEFCSLYFETHTYGTYY